MLQSQLSRQGILQKNVRVSTFSGQDIVLNTSRYCLSVQPVSVRVEEPVSPVRQSSSSGGVTNNSPFPKMPKASTGK